MQNRDCFDNYALLKTKIPVHSASGHTIFAIGIGSIPIESYVDGRWIRGSLIEVLHIQDVSQNLISKNEEN